MSVKVAIVTGANKGIGFAIVRGLCKRFDGVVYLTSRDEKRGNHAVAELVKEGLNPKYHQLDITEPKSVEIFRDYLKEKYGGIDLLVNNAAITFRRDAPEPLIVQAEQILFVNYFSLVSTCDILFPILRKGARVVNLSSGAGHLCFLPNKDLVQRFQENLTISEVSELMNQYIDSVKRGTQATEWGSLPYPVSKIGVTALSRAQQRLLNDRDIIVNAVCPGFVATDMTLHEGTSTIDEGAESSLYLALDAPDSIRGEFVFYNKKVVNWSGEIPTLE